jgi:hypothetical protein
MAVAARSMQFHHSTSQSAGGEISHALEGHSAKDGPALQPRAARPGVDERVSAMRRSARNGQIMDRQGDWLAHEPADSKPCLRAQIRVGDLASVRRWRSLANDRYTRVQGRIISAVLADRKRRRRGRLSWYDTFREGSAALNRESAGMHAPMGADDLAPRLV